LLLLGLLANHNKFESQNPYQNRLEDFVDETTIQSLVLGIAHACLVVRDSYLAVHDDMPQGWNLQTTLAYVGLRALTPEANTKRPAPSEEEAKELLDALPPAEGSVSLPLYSFVYANKLFASSQFKRTAICRVLVSYFIPISTRISITEMSTLHVAEHDYHSITGRRFHPGQTALIR
jgi:hypothetical protein